MRDTNLIFHDGTTFTATITPTSTTRSGGSAVLDLGKTAENGVWIQLCNIAAITGSGSPTVDAKIQFSDSATFASGIEDGPAFPQITTSTAAGYTRELLAQSKRRYARVLLTKGGTTLSTTSMQIHVVSGPNPASVS